ncbi:hypothetical protein ESCO_005374 [Escovopsis weberi]|uniref:Uncharacterized protein n=1 Tax=Escovopsis weberi TaxID=150374 RepID=A0A0M8MX05_ESCWE|nr:hypothetical protein ESCO_005374 [Escovopsis weberi]
MPIDDSCHDPPPSCRSDPELGPGEPPARICTSECASICRGGLLLLIRAPTDRLLSGIDACAC